MSKINEQIERLRELVRECYSAVAGKKGTIPNVGERTVSNLPTAIESIPRGLKLGGVALPKIPKSALDYRLNQAYADYFLTTIDDDTVEHIYTLGVNLSIFGASTQGCLLPTNCEYVRLRKCKIISGKSFVFNWHSALTHIYFDELEELVGVTRFLNATSKVRVIYTPMLYKFPNGVFPTIHGVVSNTDNLIDLTIGKKIDNSFSLVTWRGANALLDDSTSLLTEEDIVNGFANNRKKLLYNIREHIAKNLRVIDSGYSVTFSAEIKAAILADQETADAFTNRGWTIA